MHLEDIELMPLMNAPYINIVVMILAPFLRLNNLTRSQFALALPQPHRLVKALIPDRVPALVQPVPQTAVPG